MQRFKIFGTILLLCISLSSSFAQKGIPYLTFIETKEQFEAKNWSACQESQGAMLFANRRGLLKYDGNTWKQVAVPGTPLKIKQNPYNNIVFVLTEADFGYLEQEGRGSLNFVSLTDTSSSFSGISDIDFSDSLVVFSGKDLLRVYDQEYKPLAEFSSKNYGTFKGVFLMHGKVLVNTDRGGIYEFSQDTLLSIGTRSFAGDEILFSLPYNEKEVLLGTATGKLSLFNGKESRNYALSNPDYLLDNSLSDALLLNDSSYVFSTLYGGVIIVNKNDGKVLYTLNYENGIPDDEIFAIASDNNNGLWLTYEFGICRVDPGLPIKDYSNYPGTAGLFTNSQWYNNKLYVSTTEGLYMLSEVKNYEDVEIYLKKEVTETTNVKQETRKERRAERQKNAREKKGIFNRLFNRNKGGDEEAASTPAAAPATTKKAEKAKPQYVKKKVSRLKSIDYVFEKIKGLDTRCEQMRGTENGLLVGSSSGLYVIAGGKTEQILETRNIHFIGSKNKSGSYLVCADEGVFTVRHTTKGWKTEGLAFASDEPLFSAIQADTTTWISGFDQVYRLDRHTEDSVSIKSYQFSSVYPEELYLASSKDTLYLFSSAAIRYYSTESDSFLIFDAPGFGPGDFSNLEFYQSASDEIWLKIDNMPLRFSGASSTHSSCPNIWGLFENINSYFYDDANNCWVVDDYSRIYKLDSDYMLSEDRNFELNIEGVSNEAGLSFDPSDFSLTPKDKMLIIKVSAPFFLKNQSTMYRFLIEDRMSNWSNWSVNSDLEFYPEPGDYTIKVQAKNILDDLSEPLSVSFRVKPPFHQTGWFYLLLSPLVLGIFYLVVLVRERKLKRDKRILEEKVEQRTLEIQKQKYKIEIQKDEILAQKNDITSSITYASRIQNAILPAKSIFEKSFSDYFIFYKPRDIVSGDFYWISEVKGRIIFAVADCTGHGVPGAFMSMLGNSFLNEITKDANASLSSGEILDALRDKITGALSQSGGEIEARDGMDIALCIYDKKKKELEFSGAYNPLYLVRGNEFFEYKGDRMPIGYFPNKVNFSSRKVKVQKNDNLYLFSDGFPDQFGGPHGKKFTAKRFKQILIDHANSPLSNQHSSLQKQLDAWQTESEQIDDILVVGIRI